jgi:hypothetical protein
VRSLSWRRRARSGTDQARYGIGIGRKLLKTLRHRDDVVILRSIRRDFGRLTLNLHHGFCLDHSIRETPQACR